MTTKSYIRPTKLGQKIGYHSELKKFREDAKNLGIQFGKFMKARASEGSLTAKLWCVSKGIRV